MTLLLSITHETRYDYAAPVSLAHHLAHLRPLHDAHQELLAFDLDIEPAPSQKRDGIDAMGNAERHFSLALPHSRLRVRASSRVRVAPRFDDIQPEQSPPWEGVAAGLRYVARGPFEPKMEFALPSPYVPRLGFLRDYALTCFTPGRPIAAAAIALMQSVYADFEYRSLSTDVDTPLSDVWKHKRGVCQDFAHLMAGAMRMLGLPVRYVSGYLLTHAPDGALEGQTMTGADASHAWVQAWCPGTPGVPDDGWLDLDPTNNLLPGTGHVRVAVGRDFGDVTPLHGVIRGGGGNHSLHVAVTTRALGGSSRSAGSGDAAGQAEEPAAARELEQPERRPSPDGAGAPENPDSSRNASC